MRPDHVLPIRENHPGLLDLLGSDAVATPILEAIS
jgi:hypothetical protein